VFSTRNPNALQAKFTWNKCLLSPFSFLLFPERAIKSVAVYDRSLNVPFRHLFHFVVDFHIKQVADSLTVVVTDMPTGVGFKCLTEIHVPTEISFSIMADVRASVAAASNIMATMGVARTSTSTFPMVLAR
jgi:hypothetical protein